MPQTLHIIFIKLVHFLITFLEFFKYFIFTEKCINAPMHSDFLNGILSFQIKVLLNFTDMTVGVEKLVY